LGYGVRPCLKTKECDWDNWRETICEKMIMSKLNFLGMIMIFNMI
jgi:hypothetical protein